jgi:hypothetical protein
MPYTGFLITPNERWLQAITSRTDQWNIFWSQCQFVESASRGTPAFIVGSGDLIIFHTSVNWYHREPLAKTRENYAAAIPIAESEITTSSAQLESGVFMLYELKLVTPPLEIEGVGIDYRHTEIQVLSAEETLAILRALPPSSQTPWTQRVVARNNDLQVEP